MVLFFFTFSIKRLDHLIGLLPFSIIGFFSSLASTTTGSVSGTVSSFDSDSTTTGSASCTVSSFDSDSTTTGSTACTVSSEILLFSTLSTVEST